MVFLCHTQCDRLVNSIELTQLKLRELVNTKLKRPIKRPIYLDYTIRL